MALALLIDGGVDHPITEDELGTRYDALVARHPDWLDPAYLRLSAEAQRLDDAAVVADSEIVLSTLTQDPDVRRQALEWRSFALLSFDRYDECITVASQALAMNPSSALASYSRAWARLEVGQKDGALEDADRIVQLLPQKAVGYAARAGAYIAQGKLDLAAKDYEHGLEVAPEDEFTHLAYGSLLYETHDVERALAQFEMAVALNPGDPHALVWRAQANLALKRVEAAAADDRRVDELGAPVAELQSALAELAAALEGQGDSEGYVRVARRMPLPGDPRKLALHLARSQSFAGQFGESLETYARYGVSPASKDYTPLWLYVARGRANPADEPAARADLATQAPAHAQHIWTDTLVSLMRGTTTLEAALAEAESADTPKRRAGERCEADYYAAEQLLMHDDEAAARGLLDDAAQVCPPSYFEARVTAAERRQRGWASGSPARTGQVDAPAAASAAGS